MSFVPLYQQRVWGGRALESCLGRVLPAEGPFGESWELVDRPEAQSVVAEGPFAGWSLRALLEREGAAVMGPRWEAARPFPILVKWLDCRERLSLQVHPPAAVAAVWGGEPKTENWYIVRCESGAGLLAGLRRGVSRQDFEQALRQDALEPLVHRMEVAEGDALFVPSGRLHAIDGGNLILEIQQNSDTTYRVYDWGRVGLDGKPRQRHVEESLRSINFDDVEPVPLRASEEAEILADCPEFRIRRVRLGAGAACLFEEGQQPRILSVVSGTLTEGTRVWGFGQNVLLPYAGRFACRAGPEGALVLLTENFA